MQERTYPCLVRDMPEDEYHACAEISKSGLDMIRKAPRLYHWHHLDPEGEPFVQTASMELGSYVHVATLEPERWASQYVCAPKFDRRTKAGKAAEEAFQIEHEGKVIVPADMYEHACRSAEAVREHEYAGQLLSQGQAEVSAFAKCDETGLGIRGRIDWLRDSGSLVDLKTTKSAEMRRFWYSVRDFRYDVQAAFYLDLARRCGLDSNMFYWIAVEPRPPYLVAVYWASDDMIAAGRVKYEEDLRSYKACLESNKWPGYRESGQLTMEAPR